MMMSIMRMIPMMVYCIVRIMLIIMMMMIDNIDNSNSTKIKDRNYSDKLIQLRVREIILELIFLFRGIKNQTSNIILFGNGSNVYYYNFSNGPRSNQIMSGV